MAAASGATFVVKRSVGYFFFLFLMSYLIAGGTEEAMKYRLLRRVRNHRPEFSEWKVYFWISFFFSFLFRSLLSRRCHDAQGYLVYAVAPALGFSTVENVGYSFQGGADVLTVRSLA